MRPLLISLMLVACMSITSVGFTSDHEKRIDRVVLTSADDGAVLNCVVSQYLQMLTLGQFLGNSDQAQVILNKSSGEHTQLIGGVPSYSFNFRQLPARRTDPQMAMRARIRKGNETMRAHSPPAASLARDLVYKE